MMEFLPLYSYPNPFRGADQDAGLANFWIVKQAIQWEKFGYTRGKFKIWYVMSQWMGMDGGFLRRKNTGLDENYTYPKSTAQVLPSKNED
jgi:hypothetical protein